MFIRDETPVLIHGIWIFENEPDDILEMSVELFWLRMLLTLLEKWIHVHFMSFIQGYLFVWLFCDVMGYLVSINEF